MTVVRGIYILALDGRDYLSRLNSVLGSPWNLQMLLSSAYNGQTSRDNLHSRVSCSGQGCEHNTREPDQTTSHNTHAIHKHMKMDW